ncbi:FkbM family methyltransferase [Sulfuritortus calidifontis]|uniref:FkbM family methyltransferase n=1 Tax=Sulfuritortus calidifontis TaxID=1914471 RepID=A0A4R3JWF5_9PROT|nr:FkbM family methyltransferase [Sulfuritortus calidifontis]TCS71309.1 FkbM family methyltransferase [Sulfuritortus calidifontis]
MFATPSGLLGIPILKRLIPSILRRYAALFKHRYSVESRLGVLMLLDQKNLIDKNLLVRGAWEPEQISTLTRLARERCAETQATCAFLDIGAHWGLYSILMDKTGLFDRILAFEPEPTNFAQLQGNLFVNRATGAIEAHQLAISDHDGEVVIEAGPDFNRGRTLVSDKIEAGQKGIPCRRLDELIKLDNACVVAKIDVEGHEAAVLRGMTELLQKNHCLLQIESFGETAETLETLLGDGYRRLLRIGDDHYFSNF